MFDCFLLFCGLYQAYGTVLAGLEKPDTTLTGGGRSSLGRDPVGEEWATFIGGGVGRPTPPPMPASPNLQVCSVHLIVQIISVDYMYACTCINHDNLI